MSDARREGARQASRRPTAERGRTRDVGDRGRVGGGPVAGHDSLYRTATTYGLVEAYAVDGDRLMIKLNCGAINRKLVQVASDQPHFRSAVSMAMVAHHTGTRLSARYYAQRPDVLESSDVITATEVGIGNDPDEALSFDDWPYDGE